LGAETDKGVSSDKVIREFSRDGVNEEWSKLHDEELNYLYI